MEILRLTKIYPNFYKEEQTKNVESTLRIFKKRTEIDLECLMEGSFPEDENEIAIDRMYAVNNKISVGDVMELGDVSYTICGLVALSDYSALFSSTSDMMFDDTQRIFLENFVYKCAFESERCRRLYTRVCKSGDYLYRR